MEVYESLERPAPRSEVVVALAMAMHDKKANPVAAEFLESAVDWSTVEERRLALDELVRALEVRIARLLAQADQMDAWLRDHGVGT